MNVPGRTDIMDQISLFFFFNSDNPYTISSVDFSVEMLNS